MSKEPFDSIMAGLKDALAYAKGDKTRGTVRYYPEGSSPQRESPIRLAKEKATKKMKKGKKK